MSDRLAENVPIMEDINQMVTGGGSVFANRLGENIEDRVSTDEPDMPDEPRSMDQYGQDAQANRRMAYRGGRDTRSTNLSARSRSNQQASRELLGE